MPKVKPNETCPCMSGLKYKKCCANNKPLTKYETGQQVSSEIVTNCINILKNRYTNSIFIDISDDLDESTYKDYQLKNYNTNIVMIAERNDKNSLEFLTRVDDIKSDIMIMHRGSFRTFQHKDIERILESLKSII